MMAAKVNESALKRQFGAKIRQIRLERKMSQEELGLEAGLDLTTINEIEMGNRNPSFITIAKIGKALNRRLSDLVSF